MQHGGSTKEGTERKNAAGSWFRWETLRRLFSAGMLTMTAIGFGLGFTLRGLPAHDAPDRMIATWGVVAIMVVACGALYVFSGRIESTWRAGMDAERRVGDFIELAVVEAWCAFAPNERHGASGGNAGLGQRREPGPADE